MYYTKSFCNVSVFASNQPGVNSVLGELTQFAKTFTKELGQYHHNTLDGYDLFNFSSLRQNTKVVVRPEVVNQAISLVDKLVSTTLGRVGELYADELLTTLRGVSATLNVTNIQVGAMATDGRYWVPSWISWSDTTDTMANNHKVWLTVDSFVRQYTEYEIVVVPPFDNVDDFFYPGSVVENRLKAITPSQMMERSEQAKAGHPETYRRTETYAYYDQNNTSRVIDTYWTVLIYGSAGNNPDLVQEAIADYILANSNHGREQWILLFPDIFRRTEFAFIPMWDRYASGQRLLSHGVYSPVYTAAELQKYARDFMPSYPATHTNNNVQGLGFPYRSLAAAVIGNIENRDGLIRLSMVYPDYMNVATDSTDFNRMSLETQSWTMTMAELIPIAEGWNEATDLPQATYLVKRDNKVFIARSVNRVLMLVLVKQSMPGA